MTITVTLSKKTMMEMDKFYDDFKRLKTPPYALFQADDADCVVTVYNSGKAVFQGKTADLSSKMWIEMERHNNPGKKIEVKNSEDKKKEKKKKVKKIKVSAIGSDEVGTGDFFGPVVVTAAYVAKEQINELEKLGIKDSKKLTDPEIIALVPKFIKKVRYHTFVLNPKKYNEIYDKDTMNLNKIKAILHNNALKEMVNLNLGQEQIIVDQFCEPMVYYRYLKDLPNVIKDITFYTKGEEHSTAVAAASLISRYTFLKEFDKLSENVAMTLPKSAGEDADKVALEYVKKYGFDKLKDIAKMNFKNVDKIKSEM